MSDPVDALVLDLLEWIGEGSRPYDEVLDAWRTSCPRLPVWEEANDRGLIERRRPAGGADVITVSGAGRRYLRARRPAPAAAGRA
jgi:D-3-phosphoglycerate dehydrogenase